MAKKWTKQLWFSDSSRICVKNSLKSMFTRRTWNLSIFSIQGFDTVRYRSCWYRSQLFANSRSWSGFTNHSRPKCLQRVVSASLAGNIRRDWRIQTKSVYPSTTCQRSSSISASNERIVFIPTRCTETILRITIRDFHGCDIKAARQEKSNVKNNSHDPRHQRWTLQILSDNLAFSSKKYGCSFCSIVWRRSKKISSHFKRSK